MRDLKINNYEPQNEQEFIETMIEESHAERGVFRDDNNAFDEFNDSHEKEEEEKELYKKDEQLKRPFYPQNESLKTSDIGKFQWLQWFK